MNDIDQKVLQIAILKGISETPFYIILQRKL